MTYREVDLGSRRASRKRVGAAVGGGVVDLSEGETLVVVVGDGKALEEVRELGHDVQERLLARLEEGGVPGAGPAGKLVAFLSALSVFRFRISATCRCIKRAGTYRFGVSQSCLVHVEHAQKIGTQIREDKEVSSGVENGFVRAGRVLGCRPGFSVGGEQLGLDEGDRQRVGNVVCVDAASLTTSGC